MECLVDIVKNKEEDKSIYPAKTSMIPHIAYLKLNEYTCIPHFSITVNNKSQEILSKRPPYLIKNTAVLTSGSLSHQS